jgi:catechol 2,3-dioxygenase-like lactoylglutathione lyase family enzyme
VIDHVVLNVRDAAACKSFYSAALEPLGYSIALDWGEHVGFGAPRPDFWISHRGEPSAPAHVCFRAPDRTTVDAFHEAALAAGGRDNGPPGVRPHCHEHY